MAQPRDTIPRTPAGSGFPVTVGRNPDDYNLPPPATNPTPDLELPPPIINTHLPDPALLEKAAATPRELSITAANKTDPEPVAFGHCICDGRLIAADDSGDNLILDILWNGYPSDYFIGMWVDEIFEGRADMLGKMQYFEGQPGQVVSSIMDALKGNDYDVLEGKAHSVHTWNPAYPTLQLRMEGRWTLCFDPRISPQDYVWTKNPALILAFVLVELGYTMNWASVAAAANYCDELLGSPAVKRWEIGGQLLVRMEADEIIKLLATYADCYVDRIGGEVYLIPDTPRSANHTVSADDMIPDTIKVGHAGTGNVPDAVIVYGKTLEGQEISYTYGTPGGPGTIAELRLPWFQTVHACARKAEEVYKKARADTTIEFVGFDNGIRRTVGDVAEVTNAVFELNAELMTLIENEEISRGRWRRKYVQYDPAHNSDELYTDSSTSTTLDNPHKPPPGPTPSATEETYVPYSDYWLETDGATYQRFVVTFQGASWAYLKDYYVTIETGGEIVYSTYVPHIPKSGSPLAEQQHTVYTSFALVPGQAYTIKVYRHSVVNALSEEPGVINITALVPFWSVDGYEPGGDSPAWVQLGGGSYSVTWGNDEGNETDHLHPLYSLAEEAVPDDSTILWLRLDIKAHKSTDESVVNLSGIQMVAAGTSPIAVGNVQSSQAVTTAPAVYTFQGNLAYWGLTSEQVMQMFDVSGTGFIRIIGECEDTTAISSEMVLTLDWVKCSVIFE